MKRIADFFQRHPNLAYLAKYSGLLFLLIMSCALGVLHHTISVEANPFFYAKF
jgi:hypothetical protein